MKFTPKYTFLFHQYFLIQHISINLSLVPLKHRFVLHLPLPTCCVKSQNFLTHTLNWISWRFFPPPLSWLSNRLWVNTGLWIFLTAASMHINLHQLSVVILFKSSIWAKVLWATGLKVGLSKDLLCLSRLYLSWVLPLSNPHIGLLRVHVFNKGEVQLWASGVFRDFSVYDISLHIYPALHRYTFHI